MNKIILAVFLIATVSVSAQQLFGPNPNASYPRVGLGKNNDKTYRVLQYGYDTTATDAAGLDTITFVARNKFHSSYIIKNVVDSVTFDIISDTLSQDGDELDIRIKNSSTGKCVRFGGPYITTATTTVGSQNGTLYLTASKVAEIKFEYFGLLGKFVEVARMAQ